MTKLHEREPKPGDEFKLKNGNNVRFAYLIPEDFGANQRLIAVCGDGGSEHYTYPSGQYHPDWPSDYDIDCYVEEPKTINVWANIYTCGIGGFYHSKEAADAVTYASKRIACKEIEITYTPGEGLS